MSINQEPKRKRRMGLPLLWSVSLLLLSLLLFTACQSTAPNPTEVPATETAATAPRIDPSVMVEDQEIDTGKVTIAKVVSEGPGWLVVHAQVDGKPGPVLGYAAVADGENNTVAVEIDESKATETLYAMLHTDAGAASTYEFPGEDIPISIEGKVITPSFNIIQQASAQSDSTVVFVINPEESEISYEVGETFINQDNRFAVAVGRTTQIDGEIIVDLANPGLSTLSQIKVDISQLTSDNSRRDNALRDRFLLSSQYPIATFTLTEISGLPESINDGERIEFQVTGDLNVREVTRQVTFDVSVEIEGDTLEGEASTTILMSDFEVGPISIAGILNTEDEVILNLKFKAAAR